jgi:protein subunit release factor A
VIPPADLEIKALKKHGTGGQHTNGPEYYPVQVRHIPTGITVMVPCARPFKNKEMALEMLENILTSPTFQNYYGDTYYGK